MNKKWVLQAEYEKRVESLYEYSENRSLVGFCWCLIGDQKNQLYLNSISS